jgi:hypothetical protein
VQPQELVSRKRVLRPSSAELAREPCGICAGDPFETFQLDEEEGEFFWIVFLSLLLIFPVIALIILYKLI